MVERLVKYLPSFAYPVELRILNLQGPETRDEEEKDAYRYVLKNGDFAGRDLRIVAQHRSRGNLRLLFDLRIDGSQDDLRSLLQFIQKMKNRYSHHRI